MSVSPQQILNSMAAFEMSSPLDTGALPVADDAALTLFASALSGLTHAPEFKRATPRRREAALVSSLTYALVEVALLREQLEAHRLSAEAESLRLLARVSVC